MSTDQSKEYNPQSRLHTPDDLNLTEFFTAEDGSQTIANNSDLEAIVPNNRKNTLIEQERYWVNKPYAFVVIYKSKQDNEYQYYLVEPHLSPNERNLIGFLKDKIRVSLDYKSIRTKATQDQRAITLRKKCVELLRDYNLVTEATFNRSDTKTLPEIVNRSIDYIHSLGGMNSNDDQTNNIANSDITTSSSITLSRDQTEKIIYYVIRDFIRYDRIDGIMRDNKIEDISVSGWNSNVFIVHAKYDTMITNVNFGKEELDEFVTTLAQKANKGISKRQPNVDATLKDGSRAILMLGEEITDKGTSFTIRQFNNIPFTPIDLINWKTYSIEQMVYLWLAVENGKSTIIAGGTASGKTTTLNAISLFIPNTKRIVSIEDTREIQIPHKNWDPLMTRESVISDVANNINENDLLWNSLRMRPNYVIYGEVRGEEARSLFQNLNTGHTAFSTFHANNAEQVRVRLTTDPINVDDTSFGGLDLIITQAEVSIGGKSERRVKSIVELKRYNAKNNQFEIEKPYTWDQSKDNVKGSIKENSISPLLKDIQEENGWSTSELIDEINRRKVVLSYLLDHNMNSYTEVAAVVQGYMNSKNTVLAQIGDDSLKNNVSRFKNMQNISLNIPQDVEENIPRPNASDSMIAKARSILDQNIDLYTDISKQVDYDDPTSKVTQLDGKTRAQKGVNEDDIIFGDPGESEDK